MSLETTTTQARLSALAWHVQQAVRVPCQETPSNWYQRTINPITLPVSAQKTMPTEQQPSESRAPTPPTLAIAPAMLAGSRQAIETTQKIARDADDWHSLITAIEAFDDHPLKIMANQTLIYAGNPEADIIFIGDVPSKQDDLQDALFTDAVGTLLENMLGSINLNRTNCLLSNIVYWRPAGDRSLTESEIAICRAFFEKLIALSKPKIIVALGHIASNALLAHQETTDGNTRKTIAYGDIHPYQNEFMSASIPLLVTLHPKYLLHAPQKKQQAWHNLLALEAIIKQNKASSSTAQSQ